MTMGHLLRQAVIAFVVFCVLYGLLLMALAAGSTDADYMGGRTEISNG